MSSIIHDGVTYEERRYRLELTNDCNPNSDLTIRTENLFSVKEWILSGGKTGKSFDDIAEIQIENISPKTLEIYVIESNTHWHNDFGRLLKNNFGMDSFCSKKSPNIMFNWHEIR